MRGWPSSKTCRGNECSCQQWLVCLPMAVHRPYHEACVQVRARCAGWVGSTSSDRPGSDRHVGRMDFSRFVRRGLKEGFSVAVTTAAHISVFQADGKVEKTLGCIYLSHSGAAPGMPSRPRQGSRSAALTLRCRSPPPARRAAATAAAGSVDTPQACARALESTSSSRAQGGSEAGPVWLTEVDLTATVASLESSAAAPSPR
eukprot:COSAG01_NODE_2064_length_8507_cov_312.247740_3_plen_202_part_00